MTSLWNATTAPGCASGTMTALDRIAVFARPNAAALAFGSVAAAAAASASDTPDARRAGVVRTSSPNSGSRKPPASATRRGDAVEVEPVDRTPVDGLPELGDGHDVDGGLEPEVRLELVLDRLGGPLGVRQAGHGGVGDVERVRPLQVERRVGEHRVRRRRVELVPGPPGARAGDDARGHVRRHERARRERGRGERRAVERAGDRTTHPGAGECRPGAEREERRRHAGARRDGRAPGASRSRRARPARGRRCRRRSPP